MRVGNVEVGGPYLAGHDALGESRGRSTPAVTRRAASARVRAPHHDQPRAPRVPPAGRRRARSTSTSSLVREAQQEEESFEEGLAVGISRRCSCRPTSCSASSATGRSAPSATVAPHHAARAGHAAVVFPLGEHAGRAAAARRRRRHAARTRSCSRHRSGACCAIRKSQRARRALRRPVAAVPRARVGHARSRALPRLRGLPAAVDAPRDGAVRRAHHPRGPQHPRLHRRPILVPQRAAGAALRHRRRDRPGVPPRRSHRHAARRRAHAGQRADGLVVRDAHLAGAARQVDSRQPARMRRRRSRPPTCPTSTRRRSAPRRRCASSSRRTARIRPARRATGGWIRSASASRTSTRSAPGGRWTASFRSTRPGVLPDGRTFNGPEELRTILSADREAFARALTVEAADLRARPRAGALRHEDGQGDRQPPAGARLPVLGAGAGDRQQPAVPVAAARRETEPPTKKAN